MAQTMGPIVLYTHAKKIGRSLEPFWKKGQKNLKKYPPFWTPNPLQFGNKNFSENPSGSTLMQKIRKILGAVLAKKALNPLSFGIKKFFRKIVWLKQ